MGNRTIHRKTRRRVAAPRRAFSLIELVVVVVILGLVAAIAIPRVSRGSQGAAETALLANLTRMRQAIEMYRAEHDGDHPTPARIANALIQYSNDDGQLSATKSAEYKYGPYLDVIPDAPIGPNKGDNSIGTVDDGSTAWLYFGSTGHIQLNIGSRTDDAVKNAVGDLLDLI